jgi:hypothetical protein
LPFPGGHPNNLFSASWAYLSQLFYNRIAGYILVFIAARCPFVRQKRLQRFSRPTESCLARFVPQPIKDINNSQLVISMPGKHKLTGRPKLETGKRSRKIDARFSEDEYLVILELEKQLGISKTELVRTRLLQNAPLTIINARELIRLLDGIGTELGRSGNNINQLAHYANILQLKSALSPAVIERFNTLFSQYIDNQTILEAALRKIIRYIGK